jgi:nucleotide-binding universal stress UspA family protein
MSKVEFSTMSNRGGTARTNSTNFARILAAVDGSERTNAVVEFLIAFAKICQSPEVVILNVQPAPEAWRLRGYESFKRDEVIGRLVNDLGYPIVQGVGEKLKRVGISVSTHVEIGDPVEVILRYSIQQKCGLVVMGGWRVGKLRQWLARNTGISVGSVAHNVAQLSEIPAVVAK